jgi:hypothetical protein
MQEAKKLKIMAGAMQDAIEVVNHVWEQERMYENWKKEREL